MYLYAIFVSDYAKEDTPVPIPNTEVKLFMVDGTAIARLWESRMSLTFFKALIGISALFYFL